MSAVTARHTALIAAKYTTVSLMGQVVEGL